MNEIYAAVNEVGLPWNLKCAVVVSAVRLKERKEPYFGLDEFQFKRITLPLELSSIYGLLLQIGRQDRLYALMRLAERVQDVDTSSVIVSV